MTNLARFSPMLRFCTRVPLPSVYPSIRRSRVGFSLSQPTAPSRTRVSAHRASDRPGPKWTSLRASCVLNPLVAASGKLSALEAGGVGADAETSGAGAGDAGADHAGEEAEGVGGQPAHPATATTNSMSPSATTVDLRCKRRRCPPGASPTRAGRGRSHQRTVRISWIGSRSERRPEGLPVHIPVEREHDGCQPRKLAVRQRLRGARPYHLRTRVTDLPRERDSKVSPPVQRASTCRGEGRLARKTRRAGLRRP
jgi:hypothetical protein